MYRKLKNYFKIDVISLLVTSLAFFYSIVCTVVPVQINQLIVFYTLFISNVLLICAVCYLRYRKRKGNKNKADVLNSIFRDSLYQVTSIIRDIPACMHLEYEKFVIDEQELTQLRSYTKLNEKDYYYKYEHLIQNYYKEQKKHIHKLMSEVVSRLKTTVEYYLESKDIHEKVSVSIKQLTNVYMKSVVPSPSNTKIEDLKVFTVYRDLDSFNKEREIGKKYTVIGNTTFSHCISCNDTRDAILIQNNIEKAIKNNGFILENLEYRKYYNAIAMVPIIKLYNSDRFYFGFLAIDAENNGEIDIFNSSDLKYILFSYANILASMYFFMQLYFTDICSFLEYLRKKKDD